MANHIQGKLRKIVPRERNMEREKKRNVVSVETQHWYESYQKLIRTNVNTAFFGGDNHS